MVFENESGPVAGCMHNDGTMRPPSWSVYLASDDAAATSAAAAGEGTVVREPEDTPYGRLAVLDPAGIEFCIMAGSPA